MSSDVCSLQGRAFQQLLQGLTWKNFDDSKDVTDEMLADQLFQSGDSNEAALSQVKAVEAVRTTCSSEVDNLLL